MSNLNIHRESFVFFLWKERKKNCYYISWCNSIYFGFGFGDVKIYNMEIISIDSYIYMYHEFIFNSKRFLNILRIS